MNTLTPEIHKDNDFQILIETIDGKIKHDLNNSQNSEFIVNEKQNKSNFDLPISKIISAMNSIKKYALYLGSWEHMYLGTGVPRGLPNILFSNHPWLLILFENIYCDENGLIGEINAYEQLGWTNSKLFNDLSKPSIGLIKPIDIKTIISERINIVSKNLEITDKTEFQRKIAVMKDKDLLQYKLTLLQPLFIDFKLVFYDFPTANLVSVIPISLREAVEEVLQSIAPHLVLSKKISELSPKRIQIFQDLQVFEKIFWQACDVEKLIKKQNTYHIYQKE
ncbi:MAG: hypothetical protein IPJ40_04385 [Saprospirales bacterium]|nr:hypothetical protein [Saprospirales bacterium]